MECDVCKEEREVFRCDGCKQALCKQCGELSSSEVRVLQLSKRVMKFHCTKCRGCETINLLSHLIESKDEIIRSKEEIIQLMKNEIKSLNEKCLGPNNMEQSYASVIQEHKSEKTKIKPIVNIPNIIIKPRTQQSSKTTKRDVLANIDPAELNIGLKKIRETSSGTIIIKCNSKEDIQKLKGHAEGKLKGEYVIEETKLKNPRIRIPGYNGDMCPEELENSIRKQNHFISEQDHFRITYISKPKTGGRTIFVECKPDLFEKMVHNKRIHIGWERFAIYEDLSVLQCYKCWGLYHKSDECESETICSHCGGLHFRKNCSKERKHCVLCSEANKKYNTNYDLCHESSDRRTCPTYQYHLQTARSKIDYGQNA